MLAESKRQARAWLCLPQRTWFGKCHPDWPRVNQKIAERKLEQAHPGLPDTSIRVPLPSLTPTQLSASASNPPPSSKKWKRARLTLQREDWNGAVSFPSCPCRLGCPASSPLFSVVWLKKMACGGGLRCGRGTWVSGGVSRWGCLSQNRGLDTLISATACLTSRHSWGGIGFALVAFQSRI